MTRSKPLPGWPTSPPRGDPGPMVIFRALVLLLLLAGLVCFALYLGTGRQRYRVLGIRIVKWTVIAGLGFFAVLIADRLVHMA